MQFTGEQREALEAVGWTDEEATVFAQALVAFRESLPPRQGYAFAEILATAGAAAGEDMQGYLFQSSGLPPTPGGIGQPPPTQSNLVVIAIIAPLIGMLLPAVQ